MTDTTDLTDYQLEMLFLTEECEQLALALTAQYDVDPVVIGSSDGSWIHALVHHRASDTYLDITGVQTFDQLEAQWDGWREWDSIYPAETMSGWNPGNPGTVDHPPEVLEAALRRVRVLVCAAGITLVPRTPTH